MESAQLRKMWISQKIGSQLLATMVSNVFYGIAMCMIVHYFILHASRDGAKTKVLVIMLSISSTLIVLFDNIQIFFIVVLSFMTPNVFSDMNINFSVLGRYVAVFLTSFLAQIFYATRIWSIGKHMGIKLRFLAIPVILLSSMQLGAGLAQVEIMRASVTYLTLAAKIKTLRPIVAIQGTGTTACDLVITSSISYILRASRTGVKRTDSLLDKIIRFAIQWAAATCFCGVLTIFLFYYAAGAAFFNLSWLVNSHLHVMSVISVLNNRDGLREHVDRSFHVSDLSLRTIVHVQENTQSDVVNFISDTKGGPPTELSKHRRVLQNGSPRITYLRNNVSDFGI